MSKLPTSLFFLSHALAIILPECFISFHSDYTFSLHYLNIKMKSLWNKRICIFFCYTTIETWKSSSRKSNHKKTVFKIINLQITYFTYFVTEYYCVMHIHHTFQSSFGLVLSLSYCELSCKNYSGTSNLCMIISFHWGKFSEVIYLGVT